MMLPPPMLMASLVDALLRTFTNDDLFAELLFVIAATAIVAISLDLIVGYGGMFQLGHVGFFALGALGTTFATHPEYAGLDFFAGILFGIALTTLAVLVIGVPTLRLSGDYFAIATLGFAIITQVILRGFYANGIFQVPSINPFGCTLECMAQTGLGDALGRGAAWLVGLPATTASTVKGLELVIIFAIAAAVYLGVARLKRSPFGRALKSIREDRVAAEALGKDTASLRLKAFMISAWLASLAGSLWVHHAHTMAPNAYSFQFMVLLMVIIILGGIGTNLGPVVGTVLVVLLDRTAERLTQWLGQEATGFAATFEVAALRLVLFGALLVTLMLLRPTGIMGGHDVTLRQLWAGLVERVRGRGRDT